MLLLLRLRLRLLLLLTIAQHNRHHLTLHHYPSSAPFTITLHHHPSAAVGIPD
jgi:hypothetical protein